MSWFKRALADSVREPGSHYVVADPVEFYEWRHSGTIPKGTKCSTLLPPSEIFTEGYVIASINVDENKVIDGKLSFDVQSPIVLKVGCMPSRAELMQRYHNLDDSLKRSLQSFKQTCLSQGYVVVPEDEDLVNLYQVLPHNEDQAKLRSFGSVADIIERLAKLRDELDQKAQTKMGRAYEMADWRHIENLHTYMTNKKLPLDATKIAFLLEEAKIEPVSNKVIDWLDCHAELAPGTKEMRDRIRKFRNFNWVKDIVSPFPR